MSFLQNMSIKHKLISIIMATCIVALLLAGVVLILCEWSTLRHTMARNLSTQAEMIADNCKASLTFNDPDDTKATLSALHVESSIIFGGVYNKKGELFAAYYRSDVDRKVQPSEIQESGFHFGDGSLTVFKTIILDDEIIGTVCVRSDLRPMYAMLIRNIRIISVVLLLASLTAYAVSSKLQNIISAPILSLAESARRIGKGHFDHRVEVHSKDELGYLAQSFNNMAEDLQTTTTSIDKLNREISERKKAEEALRANKEQIQRQNEFLNTILESLTHPFYVIDANNYTIKMSNQAAQAERLCEKATCYESTHGRNAPCDGTEHPCPVAKIKETKKPVMVEHVHLDKDGNPRNVEVHGYPILDRDGAVSQVILYSLDITDRKKAEEDIKTLKQQIEFVLGATNTGLDIIDSQFNIRYIDPAWQKVYGDPTDRKCYEYFMGRNEVCPGCGIVKALETKSIVVTEELLPREDNRPIQVTTRPFQNDKREWLVAEVNVDITERKEAEETIKRGSQIQTALNELLSLSLENLTLEELLERAIDHITSIPWLALESKGAIFLVGDEPGVLLMKAQRGLATPLQTTCARVPFGRCICGRAALSGEITFVERVDEHHENRYEGIVPHGHYCVPILSAGKVLGVINMYVKQGHRRDEKEENFLRAVAAVLAGIVERKRAEQKQVELFKKVESANKELTDFAYVVSHDLKAPLRGIKTLAQWISTDYAERLDENGRGQLNLLLSRADRMHNLIDGILQYSRVGRVKENKVQVNLNELVSEVIDMVAPPENISITVENELPVIECERTRIMQVFQNLLSNAIKFMDKPEGQVRIGCVKEDSFWKFSVADNGPGIKEKYFEKIFQMFQTLAPRDDVESTGVGLTVAKKIVELYGGKIWVESKVGEGSTFLFTLPKQETEVKDAQLQASIVG